MDPYLANKALAMQGFTYRVPTPEEVQANAKLFAGVPQAGPEVSLLEQAASAGELPSGGVSPAFSMVPAPQAPVVTASEPVPPAALTRAPAAPRAQSEPRMPRLGGGAPASGNPVPGMLRDATARRTKSEGDLARSLAEGDVATQMQQQAAADLGDARSATAEDVAKVQERYAAEGAAYQERLAADQDSYERAYNRTEAEQRELSKFISEYEPKDRRSTGKRVMGAIAVAMGALSDQANLAAGLNIGLNVQTNHADSALALIQRGIDRDIEEQRMLLDNKRTALAAKNTELGQARERFGDRVDAMKLARAMKLEQAQQEVEALKTRGMAPEAQAVADQTIAALGAERANLLVGLQNENFQRAYADEQRLKLTQYQQQQAGRPKPISPKEALELEGKALDNEKKRRELGGGGAAGGDVPGGLRVVRPEIYSQLTDLQKRKIQEAPAAVEKLVGLLDEIARKRQEYEYSRGIPWTAGNEELSGYEGQLTGAIKEAEELGALDNGVIRLVQQVAGSATAMRDAPGLRLAALRSTITQNFQKKAAGYGLEISPASPFTASKKAAAEQLTRPLSR